MVVVDALGSLTACCWPTVSLRGDDVAHIQAVARGAHAPGTPVIVSCQRTEAYSLGECGCPAPHRLRGAEALFHLAEVAAGLHAVVLGEPEILGQARGAFSGSAGSLRRWADVAFAAARDLRRETEFNSHAGALLDRALKLARFRRRGRLLVLGAGQMGRLVAERGCYLGFREVVLASRARVAGSTDWLPLGEIATTRPVDVLVGCLGSGAGALSAAQLPAARLLLDFGTPLNFAGDVDGAVTLAALLSDEEGRPHAARRRRALRSALGAKVMARLGQESLNGASAVGMLRSGIEAVRVRELERMERLHPEVAPGTLDVITRSLVNQLFHLPSERLKDGDSEFGRAVAALFMAPD